MMNVLPLVIDLNPSTSSGVISPPFVLNSSSVVSRILATSAIEEREKGKEGKWRSGKREGTGNYYLNDHQ